MYFWLMIIVLLTVIEATTANLVVIWFLVSALFSLILSIFIDNFYLEFTVFVLLGTFLLITTKTLLEKRLKIKSARTNLDRVVGMRGLVTEEITPTTGEVKVDGKRWTAFAKNKIKKDEFVTIIKIDGVKLEVERLEK
jgi:membrane protein implicated in regulation of membrane protease activity